jgi:hypothetical protein
MLWKVCGRGMLSSAREYHRVVLGQNCPLQLYRHQSVVGVTPDGLCGGNGVIARVFPRSAPSATHIQWVRQYMRVELDAAGRFPWPYMGVDALCCQRRRKILPKGGAKVGHSACGGFSWDSDKGFG